LTWTALILDGVNIEREELWIKNMDKKIEKVLLGMVETGDAPEGDYIETLRVRDGILTRETGQTPSPLGSAAAFGALRIAAALGCGISKELLKELSSVFKIPPAASTTIISSTGLRDRRGRYSTAAI
jgi:hypothetical protein